MRPLNRQQAGVVNHTNRVIQFGKGNFLRGFIDWIISRMNQSLDSDMGVTIIQSVRGGSNDGFERQEGLYHVITRGLRSSEAVEEIELVDVINGCIDPYNNPDRFYALAEDMNNRFIISNTTEQGIEFLESDKFDGVADSFPAKLTQLLYRRFKVCDGDIAKGFVILPCELIERNGEQLKGCIEQYIELWNLGSEFESWFNSANHIANTLVDRIVSGYPKRGALEIQQRVDFEDKLLVETEPYNILVIEGDEVIREEFCADKAGCNVLFVDDITPYRERKVTLLNAPHTLLSPIGLLAGLVTVREAVEHPELGRYINYVMQRELRPTLSLPEQELSQFIDEVLDRFANPYLEHHMSSIMLNSFAKFKSRCIPPIKRYLAQQGALPTATILGMAAMIYYYATTDEVVLKDESRTIELIKELWRERSVAQLTHGVLSAEWLWGENLVEITGLKPLLYDYLSQINEFAMRISLERNLPKYI